MKLALIFLGAVFAGGQTLPEQKPLLAEDVFKNVQVLKGIPVDEFMGTMGIFSAALGVSCENCHAANDSKWENYAGDNTEMKKTARRMVAMMNTINKSFFGGRQVVTCFACHRGGDHPRTTPDLGAIYGAPPEDELDDAVEQAPGGASANEILDKYIQALGGAQRLAGITSFSARGTSSGYGPESGKRAIEIYAKVPDERTTIIHTDNGDNTTTYNGRGGWLGNPLQPVTVLPVTGGELEGIKLDAEMSFPAAIKQTLSQWRARQARNHRRSPSPGCSGNRSRRIPGDAVFRSGLGVAGADAALRGLAGRSNSHAVRFLRLSRGRRRQNALPLDHDLARRTGKCGADRDPRQHSNRPCEIR